MSEAIIGKKSFKNALKEDNGTTEVFDPVRNCVAKVSKVGESFFIEPAPGEIYPISRCDAMINWVTQIGRTLCRR